MARLKFAKAWASSSVCDTRLNTIGDRGAYSVFQYLNKLHEISKGLVARLMPYGLIDMLGSNLSYVQELGQGVEPSPPASVERRIFMRSPG